MSDSYATYDYDYDNLNRQMDVSQSITGLTPAIGFDYGYDDASRITSSSPPSAARTTLRTPMTTTASAT